MRLGKKPAYRVREQLVLSLEALQPWLQQLHLPLELPRLGEGGRHSMLRTRELLFGALELNRRLLELFPQLRHAHAPHPHSAMRQLVCTR